MRRLALLSTIVCFLLCGVSLAQEAENQSSARHETSAKEPPKETEWYEKITGILGIPVAILSPVGAYWLLKKTRLESRKTELEIIEKERALKLSNEQPLQNTTILSPAMPYVVSSLILRYILLELLLSLLSLLSTPLRFGMRGLFIGLVSIPPLRTLQDAHGWQEVLYAAYSVLSNADIVLRAVLYFVLGWPLLVDVFKFFNVLDHNFKTSDLFRRWNNIVKAINHSKDVSPPPV